MEATTWSKAPLRYWTITMAIIDNCFIAMVFRKLRQTYLLEEGLMQIPAYRAHYPQPTM